MFSRGTLISECATRKPVKSEFANILINISYIINYLHLDHKNDEIYHYSFTGVLNLIKTKKKKVFPLKNCATRKPVKSTFSCLEIVIHQNVAKIKGNWYFDNNC